MVAWKLLLYHGGICGVFALFLSDLRSDIDTSDHISNHFGEVWFKVILVEDVDVFKFHIWEA